MYSFSELFQRVRDGSRGGSEAGHVVGPRRVTWWVRGGSRGGSEEGRSVCIQSRVVCSASVRET